MGLHEAWSQGDEELQLLLGPLGKLREADEQLETRLQVRDRFVVRSARQCELSRAQPVRDRLGREACGGELLRDELRPLLGDVREVLEQRLRDPAVKLLARLPQE